MGGRIIYYGADEYRLRTLQNAGYTVHSCSSLTEFRWVLSSVGRADAVAFTETAGKAPHSAISLARRRRSPLVLFQCWIPHYDELDFNLVVPMLTSPEQWLGDIASLIGDTRILMQRSSELQAKAQVLREQATAERERTKLELGRLRTELERNRGFKVDFTSTEPSPPEFAILPGSSSFLRSLDIDAMGEFRTLLRLSSSPPGTLLFAEGQISGEVFFLFTGNVKLSVNSSDGKRFIVHIANPGEMLGLASAFTSQPHEVTAETCYACDLGSVASSDLMLFLEEYPKAFRAAAHELGSAYHHACARLRTMGVSFTVMAKLAGLLLEWSANGNQIEQGTQIRMALTHAEIGQCIGTTRESVTRILHDLQHRQIIVHKGSTLTILDRAALESCAGII